MEKKKEAKEEEKRERCTILEEKRKGDSSRELDF